MPIQPSDDPVSDSEDPIEEPVDLWPAHWSVEAKDTADIVLEAQDLEGAAWAALLSVGELLTSAGQMEEIVKAAGYVTTGSTGQLVAHPLASEARQHRATATQILARIGAGKADGKTRSQAGREMARARHAIR